MKRFTCVLSTASRAAGLLSPPRKVWILPGS